MKNRNAFWAKFSKRSSLILAAGLAFASVSTTHAQTLLLSLQSQNYNATTGVWTDSSGSGNNATSGTNKPTLTTNATPNGSSAVTFTTNTYLGLLNAITAGNSSGYTAFVYCEPTTSTPNGFTNGSGGTMFGGGGGSFQYRIQSVSNLQDIVQAQQVDLGHGNTAASTTAFTLLDTTTSSSGGTFRLNGNADGTSSGANFTNGIQFIGTNNTNGNDEFFNGSIADIEIYSGVMTDAQRATVEGQIRARYVNAVPEPGTWAMALAGFGMLLGVQRFRARKA